MTTVDRAFGDWVVTPLTDVITFDLGRLLPFKVPGKLPFIVIWLFAAAIFFTVFMRFVAVWGFPHALRLLRGDYDDPDNPGEVTHFQALASALSATVGLGNIAGVAFAVSIGGPGAVFWMVMAGLFGMSSKFTECTLGQLYRQVATDGTISGGPMHYLRLGLGELGLARLGAVLAVMFAVMCIGGSFGGGCAFQANQSASTLLAVIQLDTTRRVEEIDRSLATQPANAETLQAERAELQASLDRFAELYKPVYGLLMATLVGVVIIGGIRRIAATAEKIVPLMCALYILAALSILGMNFARLDDAAWAILTGAFNPGSVYGGLLGAFVTGVQRASFSNEAGVGSASIAHAAAKTQEPLSEGFVALLEPFIDTVVVCTMTGLVIVVTGVYSDPTLAGRDGATLTTAAFERSQPWFPYLLAAAVFLFAYSTMISWSYYGERCWSLLFGQHRALAFRVLFLGFVFFGSIATATNILAFSDMMILSMAFPNVIGCVLLSGKVRAAMLDYWHRLHTGQLHNRRMH
ncbi:MAG: alanine:cation symporter family protein [Pirellulales bacterium]|nr:alanine:cation symporter family protein [Pirellulales bacterium]